MNNAETGSTARHGLIKRAWLFMAFAAVILVALQGCATNRESASVAADVNIRTLKSIYVERSPQDERGLYIIIAEQLRKLGYTVSTGTASKPPGPADGVLSYQAKWQWDMTMYLLELRVTVRRPDTDVLLGSASSYHTSMTRKTPEDMVAEVLANLRGDKPVAASSGSGPGNAQVQLKAYVAPPAESSAVARGSVRIAPLRDARRDAVGALIGERTTVGNISMGMIEMQPAPVDAVGQVVRAELAALGFVTTSDETAPSVSGQLTKFAVTTPATAFYWDINGQVELELLARGRSGSPHAGLYRANCTDRTFVFPSSELINGVVGACLKEIGAQLRKDGQLSAILSGR